MSLDEFQKSVQDLSRALDMALSNKVDFAKDNKSQLLDYRGVQQEHYRRAFSQALDNLEKHKRSLIEFSAIDAHNERILGAIDEAFNEIKQLKDGLKLRAAIDKLAYYVSQFHLPSAEKITINANMLPTEIKSELLADIDELNKCFSSGCYRSASILCGRVLETVLHRKYFEVTGNDLLETSSGLGLGNLIAKLGEKGVRLDPGIANQVHLINQVRIHSVHKKQDSFTPTKIQTHAIILYTLDLVEKLLVR